MFELGTNDHWWEVARRYPALSKKEQTLKPLGYAHMVSLIEAFKPRRILEVGHGSGSFLFDLFSERFEMWGLDDTIEDNAVLPELLEETRQKYPHVKFVKGLLGQNLQTLPDNYFDMVCSVSVLEHVPHSQLDSVFADTFRILKPGGIVSHSYDIPYKFNTRNVFEAYLKNGFKWPKPLDTMTVYWEKWLRNSDKEMIDNLHEKVMTENPMVVYENFMWQIPKAKRQSPINHFTVLNAAIKPLPKHQQTFKSDSKPSLNNFQDYTYSRRSHLDFFNASGISKEILQMQVDPEYCDILTYQLLLLKSFTETNLKPGSRLLEIGGKAKPIINHLKNEHTYTQLLLDETTTKQDSDSSDSIISFSSGDISENLKLVDPKFDFIFALSDSFLSDLTQEQATKFVSELLGTLNENGKLLICTIALWKEPIVVLNDYFESLFKYHKTFNEFVYPMKIITDDDLFTISEEFYNDKWLAHTNRTYKRFGKPFCYNALLMK